MNLTKNRIIRFELPEKEEHCDEIVFGIIRGVNHSGMVLIESGGSTYCVPPSNVVEDLGPTINS